MLRYIAICIYHCAHKHIFLYTLHVLARHQLKKLFLKYDNVGRGKLTREEFVKALNGIGFGLSEWEAEALMDAFDEDKDGFIDFVEFSAFMKDQEKKAEEKALKKAAGQKIPPSPPSLARKKSIAKKNKAPKTTKAERQRKALKELNDLKAKVEEQRLILERLGASEQGSPVPRRRHK